MPKTGAVIDMIRRPEPLTEKEQAFADWCAERGLVAVFGKVFPTEDDEDFEPFFTYEMGIEDFVNGKIVAHFRQMLTGPDFPDMFPEAWELQERMLRESFERTKAEAARD